VSDSFTTSLCRSLIFSNVRTVSSKSLSIMMRRLLSSSIEWFKTRVVELLSCLLIDSTSKITSTLKRTKLFLCESCRETSSRPSDADLIHVLICRINKLKFNQEYLPAFKQIFGSTIICQTLEIAGSYTRSHNLNAITLDGDKYDRKGSLTGGYHDIRRSRLDAVRSLKSAQKKDEELSSSRQEIKSTIARIDQEITGIVGKLTVLHAKAERLQAEGGPLSEELLRTQEEEDRLKTRVAKLEKQLVEHQTNIKGLEKEVEMMRNELGTEMVGGLTAEEKRQMKTLTEECEKTKKELVQVSQKVNEVS